MTAYPGLIVSRSVELLLLLAVVVSKVAVLSGKEGEGLAVSCVFQFLAWMMDRRSNQYHYYRH